MVKVSDERYRELIEAEVKLCALEQGGVDNWNWYGESISDYITEAIRENEEALKKWLVNHGLEPEFRHFYLDDLVDFLVEGVTEDGV